MKDVREWKGKMGREGKKGDEEGYENGRGNRGEKGKGIKWKEEWGGRRGIYREREERIWIGRGKAWGEVGKEKRKYKRGRIK